jgi:hypothetical protein
LTWSEYTEWCAAMNSRLRFTAAKNRAWRPCDGKRYLDTTR